MFMCSDIGANDTPARKKNRNSRMCSASYCVFSNFKIHANPKENHLGSVLHTHYEKATQEVIVIITAQIYINLLIKKLEEEEICF